VELFDVEADIEEMNNQLDHESGIARSLVLSILLYEGEKGAPRTL